MLRCYLRSVIFLYCTPNHHSQVYSILLVGSSPNLRTEHNPHLYRRAYIAQWV